MGSGLFWGGGRTPTNVFVCVCGRGQGAEPGKGRYKNNFVFCFFSPPSPTLHFPPSPPPTPSTPQSPPPAGCLILSRFQHAVEELQVCWWNLAEKVVGPGWRFWHNKPEGNERLPLVGRVRKYDFQREFGNQREMTCDSLWGGWETTSRVFERERQLQGGLKLQWVSMGEGGELSLLNYYYYFGIKFKCAGQFEQLCSHPDS